MGLGFRAVHGLKLTSGCISRFLVFFCFPHGAPAWECFTSPRICGPVDLSLLGVVKSHSGGRIFRVSGVSGVSKIAVSIGIRVASFLHVFGQRTFPAKPDEGAKFGIMADCA